MPVTRAARSCCASRTPTASARPRRRSAGDLRRPGVAGAGALTASRCSSTPAPTATARSSQRLLETRRRLPLLHDARGAGRGTRASARRGPRRPLALARPRAAVWVERAVRRPFPRTPRGARRSSTTWSRARSRSQTRTLDDLVLLRSDGSPTYNLAVVVDDHDMGVTHVDPRRRPPEQRRAPDPDLPGAGLGAARRSATCR